MFSLSYYIPVADHERVKQALFVKGAGKIGHYEQCCWAVLGKGQYRPNQGSHPAVGEIGQLQQLSEYRVEMVCSDDCIRAVVEALLREHPYEQPAYFVTRVLSVDDL